MRTVTTGEWVNRFHQALGTLVGGAIPEGRLTSRAFIGAHLLGKTVLRKSDLNAPLRQLLRDFLLDALFFESALRTMGPQTMICNPHGFFPHIFMPDYQGPHFDEAVRRLTLSKKGPNIIYFAVTGQCPCRCDYCFARAGGSDSPDMGDGPVLEVAEAIAQTRAPLVNISGGEPMVHFQRVLKAARILNEGCEVRMFTTGIGLTPVRLNQLRDAGLKGIFVSLDTDDAQAFDKVRGREGAFGAAVEALRLAAGAGMLTFVNCVVGKSQFRTDAEAERFLAFVETLHPSIVVNFIPQLATGRGTDADSFRQPEECEETAERLTATAKRMGRPIALLFGKVDRFMGCVGAGGKLLNVDIWGNVTVCISKASLGNLLKEPFDDIYQRFIEKCHQLKVGFFCCEIGQQESGTPLLGYRQSRQALSDFYRRMENAEWQQTLNRFGWLFERLLN